MQFRNLLLSSLFEHGASGLLPLLKEVHLERGDVVTDENRVPETIFFPSTAVLSATKVMLDGSQIEVATSGFEGASGLLACLSGSPATLRVFAQIGGSAISVPAGALADLAFADPDVMRLLLRSIAIAIDMGEQSVACLALHRLPARMARWILETQDRTSANQFPLTQEYLSLMLGVQRTSVNGVAVNLKREGLISYTRGSVTVLDRHGLERQACECYRAVGDRWRGEPLSV